MRVRKRVVSCLEVRAEEEEEGKHLRALLSGGRVVQRSALLASDHVPGARIKR